MNQNIRRSNLAKTYKLDQKTRIKIRDCRIKSNDFNSYGCSRRNSVKKIREKQIRPISQFNEKRVRFDLEKKKVKTYSLTESPIFRALDKNEVWQCLVTSLKKERQNMLFSLNTGKKSLPLTLKQSLVTM